MSVEKVTWEDFSVQADRDGDRSLECPVAGCWEEVVGWRAPAGAFSLGALKDAAEEHLREKHVDRMNEEIVP